ncbi:hypothetical protein TNIN_169911 [Trichonephila inaurata madagascariensis]|uniref:Uncharacterized protein n=1 Tax=Trichonephila inaurata madagascariensis TaxID=2747483 RepID=A0A8X6WYQ9_9ARAC|nr:hypothetical protein TNIN_169911 [Trichonephila inaurata madagascariensis]
MEMSDVNLYECTHWSSVFIILKKSCLMKRSSLVKFLNCGVHAHGKKAVEDRLRSKHLSTSTNGNNIVPLNIHLAAALKAALSGHDS